MCSRNLQNLALACGCLVASSSALAARCAELQREIDTVTITDAESPIRVEKAGYIEALDANLRDFKAAGGKLLLYHGWNDPGPSPLSTIDYCNRVLATMGPYQRDWLRLFLLPGVGHCRGGVGPDQADFLGAIEAWAEAGVAPERITPSRVRAGEPDMSRPLCPYAQVPTWDGEGDPNDAASFVCQEE